MQNVREDSLGGSENTISNKLLVTWGDKFEPLHNYSLAAWGVLLVPVPFNCYVVHCNNYCKSSEKNLFLQLFVKNIAEYL